MDNPMEYVKVLIQRLSKETEGLGLHMEQVAVIPNMSDGPDFLQVVFVIQPEAVEPPKSEDQLEVDKMFEEMMRGDKAEERKEQISNIAEDIKKWLE